jgi:hypothetical protein
MHRNCKNKIILEKKKKKRGKFIIMCVYMHIHDGFNSKLMFECMHCSTGEMRRSDRAVYSDGRVKLSLYRGEASITSYKVFN